MGKYITVAEAKNLTVDHPEFSHVMDWSVSGYPVAVFDRPMWNEPTQAQREEYDRNESIVKAHGGYMLRSLQDVAGERPRFTDEDCAHMRAAVERSLPGWRIRETWNGPDAYTYSVAIERKPVRK